MSAPHFGPGPGQQQSPPSRNRALTGVLVGGNLMLAIAILAVLGVLAYVLIANPGAQAKPSSGTAQQASTTPAETPEEAPKPEKKQLGVKVGIDDGVDNHLLPPEPAPLITGVPGEPVEVGDIRVTVKDSEFRAVGNSLSSGQCVSVEATGLVDNALVVPEQFWLTSDTHQQIRIENLEVDDLLQGAPVMKGQSMSGLVCFDNDSAGNGSEDPHAHP